MEIIIGKNSLEEAVLENDKKIQEKISGKIFVFCGHPGSGEREREREREKERKCVMKSPVCL